MVGNEVGAVCLALQPRAVRGRAVFSSKHGFGIFHYVWEDSGLWTGIKLTAVPVPSRDFFNLSRF